MYHTCTNCGQDFKPKARDRVTYCGRRCAYHHRRLLRLARAILSRKDCQVCGATVGAGRSTNCSDACQAEASRQASRRGDTMKRCLNCGDAFITMGRSGFCSEACRASDQCLNNRNRARIAMVGKSHGSQDVHRQTLIDEHGCVCGICNEPINRALAYPDPMCFTVDHVKAIGVGGKHEPSNCRPAHLRCNIDRSWGDPGVFQASA